MTRKHIKIVLGMLLGAVLVFTTFVAIRTPSLTRVWDEDVSVLAGINISGDTLIEMTNLRHWTYDIDSIVSKSYFDASYNPQHIVNIWMYEQLLSDSGRIAHTFLVFEFDETYADRRYLGLSVETRREEGETYSVIGGMLRKFEITHIWALEEDLVTRRVQFLDYPLTRYLLDIPEEYRARIFIKMARETAELAVEPAWYNTATNNCTSSLIKYVNENDPGAIPFHYSYVLTGKIDDYLKGLGYMDPTFSLDITRHYLSKNSLR